MVALRVGRLGIVLLLGLTFLPGQALGQGTPPTWTGGDTWAWTVQGAVSKEVTLTVQGSATRGTERVVAGESQVQAVEVSTTWARPMALASHERVAERCITLLLEERCGERRERWTYDPPLELVRFPLSLDALWTQKVRITHEVLDELAPDTNSQSSSEDDRSFRVAGQGPVPTPLGELPGWHIQMGSEDAGGTLESYTYAPGVAHQAVRILYSAGQETERWTLTAVRLAQAPAPPPPPPSPPPTRPPPSPPALPPGPPAPPDTRIPPDPWEQRNLTLPPPVQLPPTAPSPPPEDEGPPKERKLKAPGAPAELALLLLAPLAGLARRRT